MSLIFLVGFMGVGKTTIAKKLAKKLNYDWIDTDQKIADREGISITDLFTSKGESYFREAEKDLLLSIADKSEMVIATGGGMPCFNDSMSLMNQIGKTIYLERSPKELFQRLRNATKDRPLLQQKTDDELLHYIEHTLGIRTKIYKEAHFIADRFNQTPEKIIALLGLTDF
ncbi:MAG: AAA family ATPase [Crocinitomicaceae bacterium]|jgi:shikimate kinase|nr:AAA family ATPase [Crocinitomicaceae bacterium]